MLLQGSLTVGHRAHNPKIGGSIPPPARKIMLFNFVYRPQAFYIPIVFH